MSGLRWSTLRLVWSVFVASQVVMAVAVGAIHTGLTADQSTPSTASIRFALPWFAIGAAVVASASVRFPRWQLRDRARWLDVPREGPLGDEATAQVLPFALASMLLSLGLGEGIAVLGLVQGLLRARPVQVAPFFVVSLLLAVRCFPGERWLRRELG